MREIEKCINMIDKCYCNKMRECKDCRGNHIINEKCELTPGDFCTCRQCGNAIRGDGYKYTNNN